MLVFGMNSSQPAIVGTTESLTLMSDPVGLLKALAHPATAQWNKLTQLPSETVKIRLVTMRPDSEKLLTDKFLTLDQAILISYMVWWAVYYVNLELVLCFPEFPFLYSSEWKTLYFLALDYSNTAAPRDSLKRSRVAEEMALVFLGL